MKPGDLEYLALVEKKREEIRGHKVTQMTQEETAREIANTTEGVFETKVGREAHYRISEDGKSVHMTIYPNLSPGETDTAVLPTEIVPRKRGRPKGSKNRPKEPK